MAELKPCPFCKESKELYISDDGVYSYYYVYCARCHACGPSADTKREAAGRWNAAGKEKTEMEKSCGNCINLGMAENGKHYCLKPVVLEYTCAYFELGNPFEEDINKCCTNCKHVYACGDDMMCGRAIGNLGYCCPGWELKASVSTLLTPSNSRGLDALCQAAVDMYGSKAQISKAIEELSELTTALARWQNFRTDAEGLRAIDNIREEREDVEIMLQQLDAIFGRSDEWQRKKYEHLRQIVGDEA